MIILKLKHIIIQIQQQQLNILVKNDKHLRCNCLKITAKLYDLEVIKENIHNEKSNNTRFIIFGKQLKIVIVIELVLFYVTA